MSWLRSSPLRQSLTRNSNNFGSNSPFFSITTTAAAAAPTTTNSGSNGHTGSTRQRSIDTTTDCDPRACYDSFCKHWQQAYEIIQRSQPPQKPSNHDDVIGVVKHLDYMVTLLLVELHHCNKVSLPQPDGTAPPAPCLEFLLSENLLDKLYEWGCTTGRYAIAVRLEQLKLYELLVSHSRHQLLTHEPFLRPLLKILASSQGETFPPDVEKRLVILLNQLCVVLMQNVHLLDLFFFTAAQEQNKVDGLYQKSGNNTNFIIFSLLIPFVHREGSIGHQARDALLLCMALSQKNSNIGTYIAQYSSMCPLLVTGLGGLYSRLPNSIEITSIDWHRITADDVAEMPELTLFMNALEFCNAVVQVAHEMIRSQLLDFMYQGFIVPVLGPAILQTSKGKHFQTNVDSQISAMSYFDLILRSVTEPDLLRAFVKFLLDTEKFDGERILDVLVERLSSPDANLCMVTMALFDTLLGLHCEDLMLELCLKYMLPGKHVPISYRHKINKIDPYIDTAEQFLELTPDVMKRVRDLTKHKSLGDTVGSNNSLLYQQQQQPTLPSPTSSMSKTIGANWNYYGLISGDSLYGNLHAYLFEAHYRIAQCRTACSKWANKYKYQKWPPRNLRSNTHAMDLVKQFLNEFSTSPFAHTTLSSIVDNDALLGNGDKKQLDSLQSIGESSGYESFKWRPADDDAEISTSPNETAAQNTTMTNQTSIANAGFDSDVASSTNSSSSSSDKRKEATWRMSSKRNDLHLTEFDFSEDLFAHGTVTLGPFLNAIWGKLQTFTSNTLYVNLHLTGLITRLAWYPLPLIHSLLLRPDIVITSETPSFHQVLRILKQQIDAELPVVEDSLEIIDVARSYLIDREFRLLTVRKSNENSLLLHGGGGSGNTTNATTSTYAHLSSSSPVQVTPSSSYDPFKRNDNKRKSLSQSISSIFGRRTNASSGLSQIFAFFTGSSSTTTTSSQSSISNTLNTVTTAASQTPQTSTPSAATTTTVGINSSGPLVRETSLTTLPQNTIGSDRNTPNVAAVNSITTATTTSSLPATNNIYASSASISSTTGTNAGIGGGGGGSTSTSLSLATSVGTLLGGSSERSGNIHGSSVGVGVGVGNNSEPVSLESLSSMGAIANTSGTERTRDLALCAVLLDEWLKELSAIAQEQNVVLVNDDI